ncbi:MAG: hypothetical protein IKI24_07435 [Clostridia bacterium]|nr:hypothetical protein [Clostridia bacterium]MCR4577320.1 hypothetical protein [Clostridiales bacterium]
MSLKKKIKDIWSRDMTRPVVYKTFTRAVLTLLVIKLAQFFMGKNAPKTANLCAVLGLVFVLGCFLAYLRLDGVNIPQLKLPRMKKKDPPFIEKDMIDDVDAPITTFDDLDKDEQALAVFITDAVIAAVLLILSVIL